MSPTVGHSDEEGEGITPERPSPCQWLRNSLSSLHIEDSEGQQWWELVFSSAGSSLYQGAKYPVLRDRRGLCVCVHVHIYVCGDSCEHVCVQVHMDMHLYMCM